MSTTRVNPFYYLGIWLDLGIFGTRAWTWTLPEFCQALVPVPVPLHPILDPSSNQPQTHETYLGLISMIIDQEQKVVLHNQQPITFGSGSRQDTTERNI